MKLLTNDGNDWRVACDSYGKVQHSRKYDCIYANVKGKAGDRLVTIAARIPSFADAKVMASAPILLAACRAALQGIKALSHTLEYVHPADAQTTTDAWKQLEDAIHSVACNKASCDCTREEKRQSV